MDNYFLFFLAIHLFFNCLQPPKKKICPFFFFLILANKIEHNCLFPQVWSEHSYSLQKKKKKTGKKALLNKLICSDWVRRALISFNVSHTAVNAAHVFFKHHFFLEAHLERVSVNLLFFSPDWCRRVFFFLPSLSPLILHDPHHLSAKQRLCHKELFKAWHTRILEMGQ